MVVMPLLLLKGKFVVEVMDGSDYEGDLFDVFPNDIIISIFCKLSSTATSSNITNDLTTCKIFRRLVKNPLVLAKASAGSLAVTNDKWSEFAHRFLKECADVGNLEACYILGMVSNPIQSPEIGVIARRYAPTIPDPFLLPTEQRYRSFSDGESGDWFTCRCTLLFGYHPIFGSGGSKNDKDLRAGMAICARAAFLGHIDAIHELDHCLQDGYGVR